MHPLLSSPPRVSKRHMKYMHLWRHTSRFKGDLTRKESGDVTGGITRRLRTLAATNCCVLWEILLNHKSATRTEMCRWLLLRLHWYETHFLLFNRHRNLYIKQDWNAMRVCSQNSGVLRVNKCRSKFVRILVFCILKWALASTELKEGVQNGLRQTITNLSIPNSEALTGSHDSKQGPFLKKYNHNYVDAPALLDDVHI